MYLEQAHHTLSLVQREVAARAQCLNDLAEPTNLCVAQEEAQEAEGPQVGLDHAQPVGWAEGM